MLSGKLSVYLTTPVAANNPFVHADVVRNSWECISDHRFHVVSNIRLGTPLEDNLNKTAKTVLDEGYDFWVTIDSDNPPTRNPLELCLLDRDVIGLPTPIFKWNRSQLGQSPISMSAFDVHPEDETAYREHRQKEGLQEVDAVGGGAMVIARRVLEHPDLRYQPFARTPDADGIYRLGNDLSFCRRAKQAGFRIWAHYGYSCDHHRRISLRAAHDGYIAALTAWIDKKAKEIERCGASA